MFVVTQSALCFSLIILFEKASSLSSKRNPIPESFKFPIKRQLSQNNATKTNSSSGTPLYVESPASIFNLSSPNAYKHSMTTVTVGGQNLNLVIDTGSSDLWVYGPEVSNRAEHALYDPALSPTTFRDLKLNQTFNITYAWGWAASGYVVNETVSIGASGNAVMTIGVATAVNQTQANIAEDGILGLGFQQVNMISPTPRAGFFQTLKKTLAQPIFALDFNPQTLGVEPSIQFGALDHSRANGPLSQVAIDNTQGYWNATGIVFEINEQNVTTSTGAPFRGNMIFDSGGSTFIDVPPTVAKAYYADIPNSSYTGSHGFWSIPCNSVVPDLKLYMGNGSAVYRARLINPAYENNFLDTGPCIGRLGNTTNDDTQMGNLGGLFFGGHYVVFNQTDGAPSVLYAKYL